MRIPPRHKVNPCLLVLLPVIIVVISGCSSDQKEPVSGCLSCHDTIADASHQLACTVCHNGDDTAKDMAEAHSFLVAKPAHPDTMGTRCGTCHQEQSDSLPHSLHYTQQNLINLVRRSFGAKEDIPSLLDIPVSENPKSALALAEDLLRRRCLRCHLFSGGDDYSATRHGTGCAACHLTFAKGKLTSHKFNAIPQDAACLSCHHGNRVGFDYYGRFEHDFNHEYRTPYSAADVVDRPYGVDYHDLSADIHQQRGLMCVDCHGAELMSGDNPAHKSEQAGTGARSCRSCHDNAALMNTMPAGVTLSAEGYTFTSKSGTSHPLPVMEDPAHGKYKRVSCQVCHGQWGFNDTETHLLRSDLDEFQIWDRLTVQGSKEVESLLEHNLDFDNEELPPAMSDKLTGEMRAGVWYKGFLMRRWEGPLFERTAAGLIEVVRPKLKLALSWIDEHEEVQFDSIPSLAPNKGMLPYTPHTTGPAGIFYEQRLRDFLQQEKSSQSRE